MIPWKVQPITVKRNGCTNANATSFILGDANGDGVVDNKEDTLIWNVISGKTPFDDGRYDVDGDGDVSISDITAISNIIAGTDTPADGSFYISFDLTAPDENYMVLLENDGSSEVTVAALPGTLGALAKEITLPAGTMSVFTFDSGYFKCLEGDHKGKILFSASSHCIKMWVFEIK